MRGPRAIGLTLAMIGGLNLGAAIWSHAAHVRSPAAALPATPGAQLFVAKGCVSCHALRGEGGHVGPSLDDVDQRVSRGDLLRRLRDPASVRPGTIMPRIPLRDDERAALADFLLEEIHR